MQRPGRGGEAPRALTLAAARAASAAVADISGKVAPGRQREVNPRESVAEAAVATVAGAGTAFSPSRTALKREPRGSLPSRPRYVGWPFSYPVFVSRISKKVFPMTGSLLSWFVYEPKRAGYVFHLQVQNFFHACVEICKRSWDWRRRLRAVFVWERSGWLPRDSVYLSGPVSFAGLRWSSPMLGVCDVELRQRDEVFYCFWGLLSKHVRTRSIPTPYKPTKPTSRRHRCLSLAHPPPPILVGQTDTPLDSPRSGSDSDAAYDSLRGVLTKVSLAKYFKKFRQREVRLEDLRHLTEGDLTEVSAGARPANLFCGGVLLTVPLLLL